MSVFRADKTEVVLSRFKSNLIPDDDYTIKRRAAVLIPLIRTHDNQLDVLLTLRSEKLRSHGGEVSLPGGKQDEGDLSLIHTATREAQEEIGLDPAHVQVLTEFPPCLSKSNILVTPVVGLITQDDFEPIPNPDEVQACFRIPLHRFLLNEGHGFMDINWNQHPYRMHKFEWAGYTIWGFTATVLIKAACMGYMREAEFEVEAVGQLSQESLIRKIEWAIANDVAIQERGGGINLDKKGKPAL